MKGRWQRSNQPVVRRDLLRHCVLRNDSSLTILKKKNLNHKEQTTPFSPNSVQNVQSESIRIQVCLHYCHYSVFIYFQYVCTSVFVLSILTQPRFFISWRYKKKKYLVTVKNRIRKWRHKTFAPSVLMCVQLNVTKLVRVVLNWIWNFFYAAVCFDYALYKQKKNSP